MRKSCHHQREREAGHLNLRLTPSPSGSCLSPLIKQRSTPLLICLVSLFLPLPPLPPMSPIYHFSLYSCRANHRKTSDPPWPSHLHRAILSLPPLNRTQLLLSLPSSLNLTRFYEFFLFGFIFFVFIYWEMILYICLEAEKMWATSRKCVFYNIFKNTTKHKKIFFKVFFKMPPITWKYFLFWKIF